MPALSANILKTCFTSESRRLNVIVSLLIFSSNTSNSLEKKIFTLGFKNITSHAGSTTLIYLLKHTPILNYYNEELDNIVVLNDENGEEVNYDKLLIATGSHTFIPPVKNLKEALMIIR